LNYNPGKLPEKAGKAAGKRHSRRGGGRARQKRQGLAGRKAKAPAVGRGASALGVGPACGPASWRTGHRAGRPFTKWNHNMMMLKIRGGEKSASRAGGEGGPGGRVSQEKAPKLEHFSAKAARRAHLFVDF
jgi:hypothetical protein